jgi:hypothetical protein
MKRYRRYVADSGLIGSKESVAENYKRFEHLFILIKGQLCLKSIPFYCGPHFAG